MLQAWLQLARVSNLPTVWTNVLAAWLLSGGDWNWRPLAWLLTGASLLYTGGMFLNDAADARWDREHRRERPIPSGRIPPAAVWSAGSGFLAAGWIMLVHGADACGWLTSALAAAIVAYDLFHKSWTGSVLVMGSCRTLLFLAAASAGMTDAFTWTNHSEVIVRGIALGGYVTGLSLAAKAESAPQPLPPFWKATGMTGLWLPAIATACLLAADLAAGTPPEAVWMPLLWTALLGLLIVRARRVLRTPPPANIGRGVGLLLAGIVWVDALAVCPAAPAVAMAMTLTLPLLLLWQRRIAAT